ncbi:uncharacterized protein VNE69_01198 [Vairimorpha necatrix]|uniref:Uncharacterized protein n=1 Tax=Vairimorpha necatrix TaxID=6039 RepID=A0AAX4J8H1_9MICR
MIVTINFIYCAQLITNDCTNITVYENRISNYRLEFPYQYEFYYKANVELKKNNVSKKISCNVLDFEQSKETTSLEFDSTKSSYPIEKMKNYLAACEVRIKHFILVMELKSFTNCKKRSKLIKPSRIDECAVAYYRAIREIKKQNKFQINKRKLPNVIQMIIKSEAPIEIKNIIYELIKTLQIFLEVYDMKANFPKHKLPNSHRIKIHNYNIEIFSLFKYIPIIETLENMINELILYKYENFFIKTEVETILNSIYSILTHLAIKSSFVVEIYEELNEMYNN